MSTSRHFQLELEGSAQPYLEAVQRAYVIWVDGEDDFYNLDDRELRLREFRTAFQRLVEHMELSGLPVSRLAVDLRGDFANAAGFQWFSSAVSGTPAPASPSGIQPEVERPATGDDTGVLKRRCPECSSVVGVDAKFCDKCGHEVPPMAAADLVPLIEQLRHEVRALGNARTPKQAASLPRTDLLSNDFMTRAFAVFGHALVANLLISLPLYILVLLITLAAK